MNGINKKTIVISSTGITFLFSLCFILIKGVEPFGKCTLVNHDCASQVYPFLCTLHDKLRNGESFFYCWAGGLGDGFLPTYFYYLSSPLNLLVAFVPIEYIRSFINITIFIRIILSSTTFSLFLTGRKNMSNRNLYIIPLSCAYALSGFVFGYYHESMWMDPYMIFPMVMLGYERMKNDKKPILYFLGLVYSSLCSFYMTFMTGLFLVIWFVFDEHENLKSFIRDGVRFALSSILAIGMTAMSILVSYLGIMKTHAEDEPDIALGFFGNFFNILKYLFPLSVPINMSYDNNLANVYAGLFSVCLLFVYIFSKGIKLKEKIKRLVIIIFLLISMNEGILNFIWHGFHYQLCIPNRFAYIFIFILLLTGYEALSETKESGEGMIVALVIAELFPMVSYFFVDFDSFFDSKVMLLILIVAVLVYSVLFVLQSMYEKRILFIILSMIMLFEIFINAFIGLGYDLSEAGRYDATLKNSETLISEIEKEDSTFFRSKLLGTILTNTSNILGTKGVSSFNSMMNNDILRFSEKYGCFRTDVSLDENGGFEPMDDILGIKYLYLSGENFAASTDYEVISSEGDVTVFRNNNALSLGYAVDKSIINVKPDQYEIISNINNLTGSMTGVEVLAEFIPKYEYIGDGFDIQYADTDYIYCRLIPNGKTEYAYYGMSFEVDESGVYNMYMNYSDYGIITVYVNEDLRRYEYTSFGGVLNIGGVEKGDKVNVFLQREERMAGGYSLDSYPILELRFVRVNSEKYNEFSDYLKKNQMSIDMYSDSHFNADVTIDSNQMLFTTIPYDSSWHIFENGKELNKVKLVDAFIGLELNEGTHSLEFKYVPAGFYVGLTITIVSWFIFIIYMVFDIIKGRKAVPLDSIEEDNGRVKNEEESC